MEALQPKQDSLDPNTLQRTASNPQESVWVGASAGTGKTKVLTDRVLRLLLPRDDGRPATPPNRILCLTFTKAAANEMALRINKELGRWAVMALKHDDPKKSLYATLEKLLGHAPTQDQVEAAQRLFADVIDCPGGLQIMTIHSFCQSVLGRFPIEADLPPNFDMLDERQAADLMRQAQAQVFEKAQRLEESGSNLADAVHMSATELDEERLTGLVRSICQERRQLTSLFDRYKNAQGIYAAICDYYGIEQNIFHDNVVETLCEESGYDQVGLRQAAKALCEDKGKKAPLYGTGIQRWLDESYEGRIGLFEEYQSIFLKENGEPRTQAFPPKGVQESFPHCAEILQKEAQRLLDAQETVKAAKSAQITRDILMIGYAVLEEYTRIKDTQAVLDFDDLIMRTMDLLNGRTISFSHLSKMDLEHVTPWIMYKLDQGLDHILVDEAQDTNPEQWRIIEALCSEFFSGFSARDDVIRTSFTVGDIKQSIYSFQRAAPEEFQNMQQVFDQKITQAHQVNRNVGLDISFRSTSSVLRVVDQVFTEPQLNEAVGGGHIQHSAFRAGQSGLVELWPLVEQEKAEKRPYWEPPTRVVNQHNGSSDLAAKIAKNIRNWLDRKETLPAYDRPIKPGDIMVLVRSRSAFVDQLVRAMKKEKIPVSGSDRMVLGDQLAIQDLLAIERFCLLPDDDLTLACVLKSPFLGWNEDELFSLAYNRKGTLWQELCNFDCSKLDAIEDHSEPVVSVAEEKREAARDYLARLSGRARYLGAYEFFSRVLNQSCPADASSGYRAIRGRLGDDAIDPIDEFLNVALDFGHDHIDHLQVFLDHQERQSTEIKREMDEGTGQVRIMTIHGSKGLQAPIVIMPDTIKTSAAKKVGRMLWPDKTQCDVPLFSVRKDDDPKSYKSVYLRAQDKEEQEYYRLLYVAMTRAADRLYIAGYQGVKPAQDNSWYFKIRQAMEADETCITQEDGTLCIENAQEAEPDKKEPQKTSGSEKQDLPDWAHQSAPQEPTPPRPLIPSRPSVEESEIALSPLLAMDQKKFRRGNVTHKLLQFLPDFPAQNREDIALKFVHKNAADMSEEVRHSIVSEVMDILNNPGYAPFFTGKSMAEVSVSGLMPDQRIVSGQIDRLVIGEREIWILDYKTNRPPPKDIKDVPAIYHRQMAAYRDSIQAIYPKHKIYCALLWTDGPFMTCL